MTTFFLILSGLILLLHLFRQYWTYRDLPQIYSAEFKGELYRVDATVIARRPASEGQNKSIVCFPGFLEDMRYFQALYSDVDAELILVNNANYHSPFSLAEVRELPWPKNPYQQGTIEHDGFYLAQAVRELATGTDIVLHGHSRGGAVVLEAGRQFPELMQSAALNVSAILEAPVLPKARTAGNGSDPWPHRIICYLLPVVLGLSRKASSERLLKQPMMRPTNTLKTTLLVSLYSVARNYSTCVANVRSIYRWQKESAYELYGGYRKITVVMGERDNVLDNNSMLASAAMGRQLNTGLTILRTENTNHFISLERPEILLGQLG